MIDVFAKSDIPPQQPGAIGVCGNCLYKQNCCRNISRIECDKGIITEELTSCSNFREYED